MSKVQMLKNGGMRYNNVRIENSPIGKFNEMVVITKVPKKLKSIIGKKYVNLQKAIEAIDITSFEEMLSKRRVDLEMMNYGIVPLAETAACGKVI